jgi:hypothetical protein
VGGRVGGDLVVAAAEVLYEGMPVGDDPRGAVAFESAHRAQAGFEPPVITFDRVVGVLLDGVLRGARE